MFLTFKQLLILVIIIAITIYLILNMVFDTIKEIRQLKLQYAAKCLEIEKLSKTNHSNK